MHIKSHCRNLGSYRKSRSEKKKSENNMLFLAAAACVATAQTMWKRQTHAQEKRKNLASHVTIASIMTEKEQTGDFKIVTNTL